MFFTQIWIRCIQVWVHQNSQPSPTFSPLWIALPVLSLLSETNFSSLLERKFGHTVQNTPSSVTLNKSLGLQFSEKWKVVLDSF